MKRILLLMMALLSINALQAQWRELHTGVTENLYDVCCVNANTVFVCGQNGVILKTEDGGETWRELYRQEGRELCKIAFANQNVGYAGGNDGSENGVLMRTTDGGETWEDVNNTIVFDNDYQSFVESHHMYNDTYDDLFSCHMGLFPISSDTVFIYHSSVLYKSIDGGANFSSQTFENGFVNAAYFKGNIGFIILFEQHHQGIEILKTSDGGDTWISMASYLSVGDFYGEDGCVHDNHIAAFFKDENVAKIITENKIIETTDGFVTSEEQINQTWIQSFFGSFDMDFSSENNGCYLANDVVDEDKGDKGALGNTYNYCEAAITCDGGLTWESQTGLPADIYDYLYSVAAASDLCFYISTSNGRVYKYGVNMPIVALQAQWHEYYTGVTEDLYDVFCIDENTAFVCGENGVILKTEDGGETWVEKNRTEGVLLYDIKFLGNVGYAHAGWYVLKTTDGGETWQPLETKSENSLYEPKTYYNEEIPSYDLFMIDADTLYLFASILKKSQDSGMSWFYPGGSDNVPYAGFNPYTSEIYFQDNVGYVLSSSPSTSEGNCLTVWKTTDYGNTWNIVYEIPDMEDRPWGFAVQFIDKDNMKIFPCYLRVDDGKTKFEKDYPIIDFYAIVTEDGFASYSIEPVENNGYYGSITDSKFTDTNIGCYIAFQEWYGIDCKCDRKINAQNFACITTDGGQTWQFSYDGIDGQKHLYGIDGIDTIFYIAAEGGFIYRTGTPDKLYEWYDDLTNDHVEEDLFAPAGAEWYFGLSSFMGSPMSYYKMKVIGDTVITTTSQLRVCSIITAPYLGGNSGNQYVYEENNVVYWYNATTKSFTKLYNFNANVGDSWICNIDTCSYQVTVTSIDSVTWGGRTYRVQNVTSDWNIMEGKIIDGIGYEGGLFPYMWACSYEVYDGTYPYYLRCYLEDGEMLYHEGDYDCDETQKTDRWIFPLVFTDATNNPDTVWFIQYNNEVTTLETILQEEGFNPDVDTTRFHVYFTQADGTKTRVAIAPFTGEFNARKLNAGHCEFPVQLKWNKNLVEVPCEPYGAVTYSTIESEYIGIYSVEGWPVDDDYDPWGNIFSYIDSTGPQPAAYYSEYGQYYGEEDMLQPLCESFFPMYITITRKHFHSGNIHGLTASTNGHNVILNWNYGGCEHIDRFEVYRATLGGTFLSLHTTTETHFEEENVPAGQYEYMIDGYFTDGSHIYDPILYSPYPSVTVEVQDDTVSNKFAPAGAEWYFGLSSFMGGPMSYYKMEVLGDTVVQGHVCGIITAPYLGGNGGNQYVYEENNVVYWYNATTKSFTKLYNFNANVGDSWICDIDTCSYQVTVTSIDSVTWGGRTYRVQNVTSDWNIMEGKIIDGIGYEGGLFPYMWACSYEVYDGTYPYYLRCYLEDGEMLYHEGDYDCDAVIEIDPFSYGAVLKPDVDSISWIAWSRDTEENVLPHTLYVKREADSIYLYNRSEISEETYLVGTLHEENGRLWVKYKVHNTIQDEDYYYNVLLMDMTLNVGDVFVLPTYNTATVADVYYREGRKVIVFDSSTYKPELGEPLMFIEGVGPNFISTDGPTEIYQNYLSCKFENGTRVYSTQNILFSECDYSAGIIAGQDWYYELQNPDGSITYQHLYYLADTTIREKDIDIIVRTNTLYDKGTNTTHEYIYEENGKVFWWNATIDDFTMLYNFTAMPGDEWEIKVGTESITMHVDAVDETEYNGKIFKTLQVSDADNLFSGTIVAKVGHLTSFFPEKLMRKSGESTVEGLRCLWNGTELVFKYGDKDCDEIYEQLHYGLKDVETEAFSLYPNPTEGVLTVETQNFASPQKQTTYRILNLMGQTLLEGRTEGGSTRIDVSGMSDGMYFINIEGATQKFVLKR